MLHFRKSSYFAAEIYIEFKMNAKLILATCLLGMSMTIGSCTSQDNETLTLLETGTISLGITTNTAFTKAINESDYNNTDLYTVQIINSSNQIEKEFQYKDMPERIQLNNGSYTLKAFYGNDTNASRESFYVEGNNSFQVQGEEVQVNVECKPACGKVIAKFTEDMPTYFSDYSVVYETEALTASSETAVWNKTDTDPWYLKLNAQGETVKAIIQVTRTSDNKTATVEKTYTMTPGKSWTLNIAPSNDTGNLGITITVDETTDDEPIDITVPSEWI